ncbi:MAG TPA: DUF2062 domain-containing protein [Gammaproteobacteria bacterium]
MARRLIKRLMPDHRVIREHRHLQWLGRFLHDPDLWHLNRRSVAGACFVGLFCAFIPVPFQMVLAAVAAVAVRVNLPISVVLVWVTNPLTMGPIFFFAYKIGTWVMGAPVHMALENASPMTWLTGELQAIWRPFLLGSLICGSVSGLLGALLMRLGWRLHVIQRWKERRRRRLHRAPAD